MPATLTSPADRVDSAPGTSELFLELLCADEDLLRAEFEAIVACDWPSPPPAQQVAGHAARRSHRGAPRPTSARPRCAAEPAPKSGRRGVEPAAIAPGRPSAMRPTTTRKPRHDKKGR